MDLVVTSYRVSAAFPPEEKFGMTAQIRRAATSIPANIAEGFGRWNSREFARFLSIASGSLRELNTHLLIAQRLKYLSSDVLEPIARQIDEISAMLYSLRTKIRAKDKTLKSAN
jgi:four helix bundle protein